MNGTINVFIPRTADGELMTGAVPKHRLTYPRSVDVRQFIDPLADRNLPNALPTPKAKPFNPSIAPKGWRLRPVQPVAVVAPARGLTCPRCSRSDFRTANGLTWHVERCAVGVAA